MAPSTENIIWWMERVFSICELYSSYMEKLSVYTCVGTEGDSR